MEGAAIVTESTGRSDRLKDLLLEAIELPLAARAAFLDEAVGDDGAMRARVEELVRAWDQATGMLEDGPGPTLVSALPSLVEDGRDLIGEPVGPFLVEAVIGEGGFGMVYRARQREPVQREVALKILRPDLRRSAVLARFEVERQALALLTHPAIARVYEFGSTDDGRPYFAMELVDGPPINEYCAEHALRIPERLELFRRVCLAVQHAHQKGIIHRDLKPSNILVTEVDGAAEPRVIDFGIAKALDEPLTDTAQVTAARQMLGTPRYMSPEQATFDAATVDTRSDIYSLGVVLYELLCGTTPLSDDQLEQMSLSSLGSALQTMRFPKPSTRIRSATPDEQRAAPGGAARRDGPDAERLARTLSGDLDWITMKAIDPDPARRYQTAQAFARDLERHLHREPVEARPPSRLYIARRFMARHRVGVAGVAGVFVALVIGLTAALLGFRQARTDRDAARAALEEATFVTDFLSTAISSVDASELGRAVRVADVLDEASRTLSESFEGRVTTEARIRLTLSNAYRSLGDWPNAEREARRAVEGWRAGAGSDDPGTLRAMLNLASLRYMQGYVEESIELSAVTLERYRAIDETGDAFVGGLNNYALMLRDVGRLDEVRAIQQEVLDRQAETYGPDHARTLGAMRNLAVTLLDLGRIDDAEALFVEARDRAIGAHGADSLEAVDAGSSLGDYYIRVGRPDLAHEQYVRAVALWRTIYGDRHPETLHALYNQAVAAIRSGRTADAIAPLREIVAAVPGVLEPRHPVAYSALAQLAQHCAMGYWDQLPPDEAKHLVDVMIGAARDPDLPFDAANSYAMSLVEFADPTPEVTDAALALARRGRAGAGDRPDRWIYMDTLALALSAAGEHDEALRVQRAALEIVPDDQAAARAEMETHLAEIVARAAAAADPER